MKSEPMDLPPADLASELLRKRVFWQRIMCISLVISVLIFVIGFCITLNGIDRTYNDMIEATGTVDGKKATAGINKSLWSTTLSLPFVASGLLFAIIAFIRLLSLPRERKR